LPEEFEPPKWIYLSSIGEQSETFHNEVAQWLAEHKETKLAFQPGTFQIKMGKEKLAALYAATEVIACNKEEAERILEIGETDIKEILDTLKEGTTIALINIKPLKDKDLVELKRSINKLKKTCDAIKGDIAGFGDDYIVVTPSFARIYRSKASSASSAVEDDEELQ